MAPPYSGSACSRDLPTRARDGISLFNSGEFFDAHEALEDAWRDEENEIRDLYRGILQIAVAYFHITRGNYKGAVKMVERSQKWLVKWPEVCQGVDVKQLLEDANSAIHALKDLGEEDIAFFNRSFLKKIHLTEPAK
jgi:predicted metal-dependent hydrolase